MAGVMYPKSPSQPYNYYYKFGFVYTFSQHKIQNSPLLSTDNVDLSVIANYAYYEYLQNFMNK